MQALAPGRWRPSVRHCPELTLNVPPVLEYVCRFISKNAVNHESRLRHLKSQPSWVTLITEPVCVLSVCVLS